MISEKERDFIIKYYPDKGKKWCCDKLNKNEAFIRYYASKLGLKLNKNSEFFKEFQNRARLSKIGKKRPEHSKLMKKKFLDGDMIPPNNIKHGVSRTRAYTIWNGMMSRCYNIKKSNYKYYGGRGISVCEDWKNVLNFKKWYDKNYEENKSIDRIDFNGNYEPNNCKFSTDKEQARNRRNNVFNKELVNIAKEMYKNNISQVKISEILGINKKTINNIVKNKNWD